MVEYPLNDLVNSASQPTKAIEVSKRTASAMRNFMVGVGRGQEASVTDRFPFRLFRYLSANNEPKFARFPSLLFSKGW